MGDKNSDIVQEMIDAGYSQEEIQDAYNDSGLSKANEDIKGTTLDNTTAEPINANVDAVETDTNVDGTAIPRSNVDATSLVDEMKAEGYTPDEIALAIRESGLASPLTEQELNSNANDNDNDNDNDTSATTDNDNDASVTTDNDNDNDNDATTDNDNDANNKLEFGASLPQPKKLDDNKKRLIGEALATGETSREALRDVLLSQGYGFDALDALGYKYTPSSAPIQDMLAKMEAKLDKDSKESLTNKIWATAFLMVGDVAKGIAEITEGTEDYKQITASLTNAHTSFSSIFKELGAFGPEKQALAIETKQKLNEAIVQANINKGYLSYISEDGKVMIDIDGQKVEATAGFWEDMKASKFEITGSVGGAIAGAKLGAKKGPKAALVGGTVGGALGAATGKFFDMQIDAAKLQEQFDAKLYVSQMAEAGATDAVMGLAGTLAYKGAGRAVKAIWQMPHAIRVNKADKLLDEIGFYSDREKADIIKEFESKGMTLAGKTDTEKVISGLAQTGENGFDQVVVNAASFAKEKDLSVLVKAVDDRAKGTLELLKNANRVDASSSITSALKEYEKGVKDIYATVRDVGVGMTPIYKLDLGGKVIKPLDELIELGMKGHDQRQTMRFRKLLEDLEPYKLNRGFDDLLNIRALVNKTRFAKSTQPYVKDQLSKIINEIDSEVARAIHQTAEPKQAKAWLKSFSLANKAYSEMFVLKKNAIIKEVLKNKTPKQLETVITNHMESPEILQEAFKLLPKKVRSDAEMLWMNKLTEKYTITGKSKLGTSLDEQAIQSIDYGKLAADLHLAQPSSADARHFKHLVTEYSKIARADPIFAKLNRLYTKAENSNFLFGGPVHVAKASMLARSWNLGKSIAPGGNSAALLRITSELLANPTDAKAVKQALSIAQKEKDTEFGLALKELQQVYAEAGIQTGPTAKIKIGITKDTGYGWGASGTFSSKHKGTSVQLNNVLDGTRLSDKEIEDILASPASILDKGYVGIKIKNGFHFLDESMVPRHALVKPRVEFKTRRPPVPKSKGGRNYLQQQEFDKRPKYDNY